MSLASVYPADLHSRHSSLRGSHSVSSSLDDLRNVTTFTDEHLLLHQSSSYPVAVTNAAATDHVLTIEELRLQLNSCFTCGVSWADSHVSLDCSECGGYSLVRPCPLCDGVCNQMWKRDLTSSHACGKARWNGKCDLQVESTSSNISPTKHQQVISSSSTGNTSAAAVLAQELCARLEKLQATS